MAEATEDSGYSPLLAQLLKVDPNKVGSISLSALGRQAMGADTEAYQKAKAEVDAARQAMVGALQDRKGRIDPQMLALAQGFLAPTRTGSFGESLGAAVGKYGEAQKGEEERAARMAQMRYELARAALGEETQAAQLGLSVASKLSPKLTAYQQQVQSEGIDPRSPEGINRIKELLAVDKATPEMKAFAAQAGISLTDPAFSAKFQQFETTKGLRDIATRLNLNLNDPAQLARAQQEAQREAFRRENPEVAKKLQQFGGDPLKPQDLARAQRELQIDVGLEREGKVTSIDQAKAATTRTRQEIDEHIRQGDLNAITTTAREAGVPIDPKTQFTGLNKKEIADKRAKAQDEATKYINEKVAPHVATIDDDLNDLRRALQLNSEVRTGVSYGLPGVGGAAKLLSGDRAKLNEFESIAARSAKQNRIPGDSNVSNADMAWMRLGTFSVDKEPITNENIIRFQLAQRQRDKDYYEYLQKYAAVNGAVGPHAQSEWRKYLEANPITTRDASGKIVLNENRIPYQQYFSMPRVRVDAQGREIR